MSRILSIRKDWKLIETLMEENRSILDIGCGDGMLMDQLERNLNAITHGIEKDRDLASKAIAKGFNVIQGDAEIDLSQYSNNSFDYVILSQTLQAMIKPKDVLLNLLRVGNKAIVSFPIHLIDLVVWSELWTHLRGCLRRLNAVSFVHKCFLVRTNAQPHLMIVLVIFASRLS